MLQLYSLVITSVFLAALPVSASPSSPSSGSFKEDGLAIASPRPTPTNHFFISQTTQQMPTVQNEDWTKKDVKLPWDRVALDKSSGAGEPVVFTKSYKFKVGFISSRKERVHVRWTQDKAEIYILYGSNCSAIFGCESGASYGLPKQITVTVNRRDYFLSTIDQNTYGLTPELKQAIAQTTGRFSFKIDKKINFEIKEEGVAAIKQLFAIGISPK